MEELLYYTMLYDIYGGLLTEKQRSYFEDYYFKNLSLSELAIKYQISRNAIHKNIKDTIGKLNHYEENLHLVLKTKQLEEILSQMSDKRLIDKLRSVIEL